MSLLHRIIGLIYAGSVGAGLWFFWPPASELLRGTWMNDLRIPIMIIYALAGLWIAEKIWSIIHRPNEGENP